MLLGTEKSRDPCQPKFKMQISSCPLLHRYAKVSWILIMFGEDATDPDLDLA